MQNIFIELMPPWVETGLQPAFYDKESGTVLQQVARMYAKVNWLIKMFNKFSKDTTDFVNNFVDETNTEIERFENATNDEIERFENATNDEIARFEHDTTETVNDYIARFVALKDFVDDYFDNLDVQEEINNKLDDMLEQGTLQEIITTYIQSNVEWTFDTVADMKLATNFVNGSFATTLGFYSKNDKGGSVYKIRTKTVDDTADEMTLIDLYDNTLIAELIKTDIMNVKQFGAKGDGTNDDTTPIQTAFNYNNNINIPSGTYMIDAEIELKPNTGNRIVLDKDATLKAITNSATHYRILAINNVNNVEVSGGTLEGDRLTHTGVDGEWGAGIRIYGTSDNIYIHDILIKNTWGDGLTVATTGNVQTERVHVDNARRNGFSIVSANVFVSTDDFIENTNGTNPQAGVDVEPDSSTNTLKNIVFNNLFTKNNASSGIALALPTLNTTISISINGHHDDGSVMGLSCTKTKDLIGSIIIKDSYLENSGESGIRLWRCYDGDCAIKIIRPYIYNCNKNNTGAMYGSGIVGYVLTGNTDYPIGNIEIVEPYIHNYDASITSSIRFTHQGSSQPQMNNIKIIDPVYLQNKPIVLGSNTNTTFTDKYEITHYAASGGYNIQNSQYYSLYTNTSGSTGNRTITIADTVWVGRKFKIRNMNNTFTYSVQLPTTDYCHQLSNTLSPKITLPKIGDTIEIEKIDATEWIVTEINCTPTVS